MPLELSAGARVAGRFELEAPNGELGLGEVWSATDRGGPLGAVSVSRLGAPSPEGPTSRVAFEETVSRLRALSNPGLATVLAGGDHDGTLWLATERLEGRSLANWIEGWRQIEALPTFGAVQRIVDKLCTTLQFAHGASGAPMLHRGLNPRSVLLRRTGPGPHLVKLVDLGVAPFAFAEGGASRQWAWMAPEQLPQPAMPPRWNEGPTADVFSLAVMTVELLTNTPLPTPDGRETWATRARQPGVDLVAALVALRGDVPRAVWEVLGRSLSSSPRARPQSVQQLQRALREAWQSSGEWDRSSANDPDPPMPSAVPPPPRPAMPAGSAASAISGWRSAERVAEPTAAPVKPAVQYGATMRTPRGMIPTEHAPIETPASPRGTTPDPTEYVNLGARASGARGLPPRTRARRPSTSPSRRPSSASRSPTTRRCPRPPRWARR
ncbi:MAG: protein kinase [Polyangiales bacterium]